MTEDGRISEIRAVLDELPAIEPHERDAAWRVADSRAKACQRIRSILGSGPPAPRVFLPGDEVPVGTVITAKNGSPFRVPDAHTSKGMARVGAPFVEVAVSSPEEWQAAVDRAHAERDAK